MQYLKKRVIKLVRISNILDYFSKNLRVKSPN